MLHAVQVGADRRDPISITLHDCQVSLLFPFFSASFVLLIVLELLTVVVLSRFHRHLGEAWRPTSISCVARLL